MEDASKQKQELMPVTKYIGSSVAASAAKELALSSNED
jgi:hypothetical protein